MTALYSLILKQPARLTWYTSLPLLWSLLTGQKFACSTSYVCLHFHEATQLSTHSTTRGLQLVPPSVAQPTTACLPQTLQVDASCFVSCATVVVVVVVDAVIVLDCKALSLCIFKALKRSQLQCGCRSVVGVDRSVCQRITTLSGAFMRTSAGASAPLGWSLRQTTGKQAPESSQTSSQLPDWPTCE